MRIDYKAETNSHALTFETAGEAKDVQTILTELLVARENTETDARPAWMTSKRPLDPGELAKGDVEVTTEAPGVEHYKPKPDEPEQKDQA